MYICCSKYLGDLTTSALRSAMRGWRRFFVSASVTLFFVWVPLASFAQSPSSPASPASSAAAAAPPATPEVKPKVPQSPGAAVISNDAFLRLDSLRFRIVFDSALFDAKTEKLRAEQLVTFCKVWQDAFLKDKGPWGYGIASDVSCGIRNPAVAEKVKGSEVFDLWTVTVEKLVIDEREVIQASICRFKSGIRREGDISEEVQSQKCEARKVFPWSDFKLRFVRHRAFVRLLVASLLDQLPFYSMVTKSLIRFDSLRIEGYNETSTLEVNYPAPPPNVLYADVRYDPSENRFRLKELSMKDAIYRTMTQTGTVWIISRDGRGARNDEFTRNIESAFVALTTVFQVDQLKFEKDKAKLVVEKLKSRPYVDLIVRADGSIGIPVLSLKSGYGANASLALRFNSSYGGLLSSSLLGSQYQLGTQVEEKDNSGPSNSSSSVKLQEIDIWLTGRFYRSFQFGKVPALEVSGGPRVGFVTSDGDFKTAGGLPQENLSIRSREMGLGVLISASVPLSPNIEAIASSTFDFGATAKSTSSRTGLEIAWILSRLSSPGRTERPPGLRFGAGSLFSSLGRRFINNDAARSFQTLATLNGLQTSIFIEQAF